MVMVRVISWPNGGFSAYPPPPPTSLMVLLFLPRRVILAGTAQCDFHYVLLSLSEVVPLLLPTAWDKGAETQSSIAPREHAKSWFFFSFLFIFLEKYNGKSSVTWETLFRSSTILPPFFSPFLIGNLMPSVYYYVFPWKKSLMLMSCATDSILFILSQGVTTAMNCVSVTISISCAGLISDWCILTYQGPLILAEQNQLLILVTVSRHITFTVIWKPCTVMVKKKSKSYWNWFCIFDYIWIFTFLYPTVTTVVLP